MLDSADLVAFVPTTDLDRARRFYGDLLALPLIEQTGFACVFKSPNATLRVTAVERPARAPYTVLGWRVPDIHAAVRELNRRGVRMLRYNGMEQDELGVWTSPSGARVAWFEDPDANVLSLTEM
jgi:catechol 2,3-dioxygenase-like lactoylglutathione lyase family enzyme